MNKSNHKERTLAFKKALVIQNDELKEISGGSMTGTTSYTTKETVDQHRNWDVGGDIRWD
ncbi:hypothetical protein [Legionella yabuuchiae]|uniref:hypothetical protein n=1 Tax=Legionella yabuuchiae TaxID=376727 RepID=UPI00105699C1|nr:hypothetical protein [Legionella yabuuchiae]